MKAMSRIQELLEILKASTRNEKTNWWTSGLSLERRQQQQLVDTLLICLTLFKSRSPSIQQHVLPIGGSEINVIASPAARIWQKFVWAFKIHLK